MFRITRGEISFETDTLDQARERLRGEEPGLYRVYEILAEPSSAGDTERICGGLIRHADGRVEDEPPVPIGDGQPEQDTELAQPPKAVCPRRAIYTFVGLLAASLLGSLAMLPFTWTVLKGAKVAPIPEALFPVVMVITVIVELFISAASIGIGLTLGPVAQLGQMVVAPKAGIEPSPRPRFWMWVGEPLMVGMVLGGLIMAFAMGVNTGDTTFQMPSAWEGFLASIGAGIREEVWLRYGFMTLLAGLGCAIATRLFGINSEHFTVAIITSANIAAALMFAAIHIPQAHMLMGLSAGLLVFVFFGNGVPGFVFGWLYWRRGLVPAMVAHFGLDLVLKVIVPLVSG